MKLILLVVCATAFQTENGDQFAAGPAPTHEENHIRDCQLLDATHPFFSQYDHTEHDCDVSSNAIDTVEADTVMDMNELTCNLFCGKINHGDCQCDETECDKNDQLVADTAEEDNPSVGQGTKCTDADSPVTPGGKNPAACAVDFECTMNGPMSYCGESPETIDAAICVPAEASPTGAFIKKAQDGKWKDSISYDPMEKDMDVSSQVADLQHVDDLMDGKGDFCKALCGKLTGTVLTGKDCQCNSDECNKKDNPIGCDKTDTCKQDFECLYLGGLEYCGQVSHEGAATFDVKMCNEV